MSLRTPLLLGLGILICVAGAVALLQPHLSDTGNIPVVNAIPVSQTTRHVETLAGLCPWRTPSEDLKTFFPSATAYREETLILSGRRIEVGKRLGHTPTGEENALKMFRILHDQTPLGAIVTRRVRGESGVIELVLAVGSDGKVIGIKIQRLREPDSVAQALQSAAWHSAFCGKTGDSGWKLGADIPDVIGEARSSANAILEGVRTALILLDVGNRAPQGTSLNDPIRIP